MLGRICSNTRVPFAVGDRVIQTTNNYELGEHGIMNGSTGVVVAKTDTDLMVDFDGEIVTITGYNVGDLDHAYGITVHKAQGSQYRVIIIPMYMSAIKLLNRQLLYTAITRATDLVIIVGIPKALDIAVQTDALSQRITAFSLYLQKIMNEENL